jgi:hypothetical protein
MLRSAHLSAARDETNRSGTPCAQCANVENKPMVWLGQPQTWRSGTPTRYFPFNC